MTYDWLNDEPAPRMIVEARKLIGTREVAGKGNNPVIIAWAKEVGIGRVYTDDEIPWCGLFVALVAKRAGKPIDTSRLLTARSWSKWGDERKGSPILGDVLVFWRGNPDGWRGHVGLYVGEDDEAFHVLGGNQNDSVSIVRLDKQRLLGARHYYKIGQPSNVRRVFLKADGKLSENEQ
jgi:uncharacterized protein (TIGR02594 family)